MARITVSKNIQVIIQASISQRCWRKECEGTHVALPASHKLGYLNDRRMSRSGVERYSCSQVDYLI